MIALAWVQTCIVLHNLVIEIGGGAADDGGLDEMLAAEGESYLPTEDPWDVDEGEELLSAGQIFCCQLRDKACWEGIIQP